VSGAPPGAVTHARVLRIALPIVASNVTVPLLGLVDTGVVGQLGEAAPIGAVALGAIVLTAVYWVFGFLRMGTTGLAGQALGAGDRDEAAALLTRALMIAGAGGLALIAAQGAIMAGAFALAPASAEVEGLARDYMAIRIWSAPAAIAVYGLTGWLIAAERARAVLAVQVGMNGINVALDLAFVLGLGWGVEGVAAATVIAEISGAALGLWLCRDAFARPGWRDPARVFDRARLVTMARVNRDILIRSALLQAIFYSIGFWLIGVPAPLVLGPAVAFVTIIPYAGLLMVPIVIVLLWLEGHTGLRGSIWWILLAPLVWYQIAQMLDDYVLTPLIQGKSTDLDTPAILFASIGGGILLGFFGLLVAIPLAACAKILFKELVLPRYEAWTHGQAQDFLPLDRGD